MADAIVGPLLSKLQDVAVTEGMALAALGDDIDRLRGKLMWLNVLVHESDLRSRTDDNQQSFLLTCQVREVAFAAEDAIDHFFMEADLSRFGHDWCQAAAMFFSNFCTQIRVRYILSRKIKSMNSQLEDIFDNSAKYGSKNGSTKVITWRASSAIPPVRENWDDLVENNYWTTLEDHVINVKPEERKRGLYELLLDINGSHVIYVVGESGIGKRYLVKKAYEHETIKCQFEVRVWASFPPDTSNITDQIKRKLEDECSKLPPGCKNLDQVKYLVVVDCPMSSIMHGDLIEQKSLKGREGSKIVLTATFSPPGNEKGKFNVIIVELGYLFKDKSTLLFNRSLGLRGRRQTAYKIWMMDTVCKHIEEITKGLPLAVILLAKLMRTMDYSRWEEAWKYIKDNNNNQDDVLMTIVSMGIDDLPNDLKSCLLYTAGFPERSTIDAGQLVRLWVAEGFLTGVEPEELGQRYLKEFIFRGLMQQVNKKADAVESVAIHDRVHRIFRSEAQRIGFMETHYRGYTTVSARRLALNNKKMPDKTKRFWTVRAVLSHDGHAHDAQGSQEFKECFSQLLTQSTFLRVISLEGINIGEKLPSQIGNMLYLQYLGVRCPTLTTVPDSIGKLRKLQTMDVRGTEVKTLPMSFWKIKTLRHVLGNLEFPDFAKHLKTSSTEASTSPV